LFPDLDTDNAQSCPKPYRVFVPLCGKTVDMAYFATQPFVQEVVGVDGIQKALDAFALEHPELAIQPKSADAADPESVSAYRRMTGNKITLLQGDFFGLDETVTGGRFDAIFDRASLVAIEPALRVDYATVMSKLVAPGGRILLVTIERISGTEQDLSGPPYSVTEAEVRRLYEGQAWVESVTFLERDENDVRNQDRAMVNLSFIIQAK
jgi:thiopurine S-methyltransferase